MCNEVSVYMTMQRTSNVLGQNFIDGVLEIAHGRMDSVLV